MNSKIEAEVKTEIAEWSKKLKAALLRVENAKRAAIKQPKLDENTRVFLPTNFKSSLLLMNLKAWQIRYEVSLDFILEKILFQWQNRRVVRNDGAIRFGLPVDLIIGPRSQKFLEEAIVRTYPNEENKKMLRMPRVDYSSGSANLADYEKEKRAAQAKFAEEMEKNSKRYFRREI